MKWSGYFCIVWASFINKRQLNPLAKRNILESLSIHILSNFFLRINSIFICIDYRFRLDTSWVALHFVLMSNPFNPTLSLFFQYGDEQLIHNDLVLFQYNYDKCFSYSRWAFIQEGFEGVNCTKTFRVHNKTTLKTLLICITMSMYETHNIVCFSMWIMG